ncbi:MAG: hypothetical protein KKG59_02770 [Nanoarchaeota archaeon]|nr:hypothetical protein [Nanoarchaeota archaeon]
MKKLLLSIPLLFLMSLPVVFADGMMVAYDPDMARWRPIAEDTQLALINYDQGMQSMLISVSVEELKGESIVWLFPVPAQPEDAWIDILEEFPMLYGKELTREAKKAVSETFTIVRLSQAGLFPLFFMGRSVNIMEGAKSMQLDGLNHDVSIHQQVDKLGLTSQLITAKDSHAFEDYLASQNLILPPDFKEELDDYIGKDYSFVISWVSDPDVNVNNRYRALSVFIQFPTDKMYFPLKPTSVYGDAKIPAAIYVMGYVTPELFERIQYDTTVEYFKQEKYRPSPELNAFFSNKREESEAGTMLKTMQSTDGIIKDLEYTKIKIDTTSRNYVQDLWIEDKEPPKLARLEAVANTKWLYGWITFLGGILLATMLSGMIFLKNRGITKKRLALFSLFNLLGIVGFAIAAFFWKTNELTKRDQRKSSMFKYVVTLAISAFVTVLWWIIASAMIRGGMRDNFFSLIFIMSTFGAILVMSFFLSTDSNKNTRFFDFKRLAVMIGVNVMSIVVAANIMAETATQRMFALRIGLGIIRSGDYIRVSETSLFLWFLLVGFTLSVAILMLCEKLWAPARNRWTIVHHKDMNKLWFVIGNIVVFLAITFIVQGIVRLLII